LAGKNPERRRPARSSAEGGWYWGAAPTCPAEVLAKEDDNFPPPLFELWRTSKFFFGGK